MFTVNPFSVSRSYKVLTKPENFYPVHRPNFTFIGNFLHLGSAEKLPTHYLTERQILLKFEC